MIGHSFNFDACQCISFFSLLSSRSLENKLASQNSLFPKKTVNRVSTEHELLIWKSDDNYSEDICIIASIDEML